MAVDGTMPARSGIDPDRLMARIQELTERVDKIEDDWSRTAAEELTAAVVQLYGAGLERIVELLGEERSDGETPLDLLAGDDLVAGLMLIHDLFPVPVEQRVAEALERVRPYMDSHGGDVELLGVRDGVAYLRLEGSCRSCAASSATLELAVRQALEEAAPDLIGMEVEGVAEPAGAGTRDRRGRCCPWPWSRRRARPRLPSRCPPGMRSTRARSPCREASSAPAWRVPRW